MRPVLRVRVVQTSLLALIACTGKSGPNGLVEGQECASPGSQGSCAPGLVCKAYTSPTGAALDICRATCSNSASCEQVFTENVCVDGFCSCVPGPVGSDACTADDPTTVCDPDFDYCAAAVGADAGCGSGMVPAAYNGVFLCRPAGAGDAGMPDSGPTSCGIGDTQGDCPWPQFCSGAEAPSCAFPQNVDDAGQDAPSQACELPTDAGNADAYRAAAGNGFAAPSGSAPGGPIIMTMAQDPSGTYCGSELHGADPNNPALGTGDGTYCAVADDVVVFTGYAYDPSAAFDVGEGMKLDAQFFAVVENGNVGSGEALSSLDSSVATNQIGHVVPSNGNWSAAGGYFVLWRCFLNNKNVSVSSFLDGTVPAHYAQTTSSSGNTFCATWETGG